MPRKRPAKAARGAKAALPTTRNAPAVKRKQSVLSAASSSSSAKTSPRKKAKGQSPARKTEEKNDKANLRRYVPPDSTSRRKQQYRGQYNKLEGYLEENEAKKPRDVKPFSFGDVKAKIIGFYNFKGGVGKTSNLINTAAQLAANGKRVLAIDADPQCNLTNFYRPPAGPDDVSDAATVDADDEDDDGRDDLGGSDNESGSSKVVEKRAPVLKLESIALHSSANKNAIDLDILNKQLRPGEKDLHGLLNPAFKGDMTGLRPALELTAAPMPNEDDDSRIFYIPGSPLISEFESSLSLTAAQPKTSCMYFGAFRKLLIDTAALHEIDFVLVDFGPSVSTMNKVFLLSCDYILPPLFADFFSLSSMDVLLKHVIPSLIELNETITTNEALHLDSKQKILGYAFNPALPRILPFIVTNFAIKRNKSMETIQIQPGRFVSAMHSLVKSNDIPRDVRQLFVCDEEAMVCALCGDLQQLQHLSHDYGIAAAAWSQSLIRCAIKDLAKKFTSEKKQGKQRADVFKKHVSHASRRYDHLSNFLISVTSEVTSR